MEITAIIPNYNHARFLQRRLESVYGQSYPHLRVILLDDASTDNSRVILETFRSHARTQAIVYNDFNSGSPFFQWNKGLALAETEWVWIAESDDWCGLDFLEKLSPSMKEPNAVMAFARLTWVDETEKSLRPADKVEKGWFDGREFVRKHLFEFNILQNAGMLIFKKQAALAANPKWVNLRQAGDYWLWSEIAAQGKVYSCGEMLSYFTRHSESVTAQHYHTPEAKQEIRDTWVQMLKTGTISQADLQHKIETELEGLICMRNAISSVSFENQQKEWVEFLTATGIPYHPYRVQLRAWLSKWKHWKKKRIAAFSAS